ncbi:MAG: ATP-grasp domain-containing protein [Gammaproteobacteria bacterium]
MTCNVFIIGLDSLVEEQLKHIPHASLYNIMPLLTQDEITRAPEYDMRALTEKSEKVLDSFPGSIDAIVTCWDFPSNLLAIPLRSKRGLPSPALEAALRCEHKYWSRVVQAKVMPESVPEFQAVDPFADDPLAQIRLPYPFWLKPVKSYGSHLGFRINNEQDLQQAIPLIRKNIGRLGKPFDYFLEQVELPAEIRPVTGHHCIAEAIISRGRQCTLEGYVQNGYIDIYGVVDSIRDTHFRSCFARYEYPSNLPQELRSRMTEAGKQIIKAAGLDNSPFNIEFYYDRPRDHLWLLEINTRISRSHTPLFQMVDGASHLKVMLDVGLGRPVHAPHREGNYPLAAKFMLRVFKDKKVEQAPGSAEIEAVQQRFPGSVVEVGVKAGMRLSEMINQDAYSYEIMDLFLGAQNHHQLMARYRECLQMLPFRFSSPDKAETP